MMDRGTFEAALVPVSDHAAAAWVGIPGAGYARIDGEEQNKSRDRNDDCVHLRAAGSPVRLRVDGHITFSVSPAHLAWCRFAIGAMQQGPHPTSPGLAPQLAPRFPRRH
jgi:hypothetical protein